MASKIKIYLSALRFINILVFFTGVFSYCYASWYWENVCAVVGCSSYFKLAYLAPLREAGLVLAAITLPFLFIPTWYFKKWLKYVAPYIVIFTMASMLSIDPDSSNMFNNTREEMMAEFLSWWLPFTLAFISYQWYKNKNK